jgi:hypothetical protein
VDLCPAKPVRHGWRTVDLQAEQGLRSAASIHSVSGTHPQTTDSEL